MGPNCSSTPCSAANYKRYNFFSVAKPSNVTDSTLGKTIIESIDKDNEHWVIP